MKARIAAVCLLLAPHGTRAAPEAARLYLQYCQGCHGAAGHGVPAAGIPDLAWSGAYVAVPDGRRYLVQVPGLAQSRVNDTQAALLLNYVLQRFSAGALPPGFLPYSAAEVARLRASAASDAPRRRAAVLAALPQLGRQMGQ